MTPNVTARRRIALLVESSRSFGRGIVRSIAEWVREHQGWEVFYQDCGLGELLPSWFKTWEGDGIIARLENRRMINAVMKKGLPAVDVRGSTAVEGIPVVRTDDRAVAESAVRHFADRGFRQLGFCGYPGADYSDRRCEAFCEIAENLGLEAHVYTPRTLRRMTDLRQYEQHGLIYESEVAPWIAALPRPIGLMACNDVRGHQVLSACREIGAAVPEEVAVIGVDNYDVLCELAVPPLSSIEQNTRQISRRAALILDRMMDGNPAPPSELIQPGRLVTRQSSDVLAIEDADVAHALYFIREHATRAITVTDVLQEVLISRRDLERRFEKILGRSPKQEIQRVRFQYIRQLLAETDLPVHAVARKAGFEYPEHMITAFKRAMDMTPNQYRAEFRRSPTES